MVRIHQRTCGVPTSATGGVGGGKETGGVLKDALWRGYLNASVSSVNVKTSVA